MAVVPLGVEGPGLGSIWGWRGQGQGGGGGGRREGPWPGVSGGQGGGASTGSRMGRWGAERSR
jgi:hypothetical protein